jgi:type IV secretion system protein VirB2
MKIELDFPPARTGIRGTLLRQYLLFLLLGAIAVMPSAFAQDATSTICGFLGSINTLLNVVSVVIVTIAIVFSGYQIAFAHKRIAEVAPVLIGAILIGAASQIAKMILGSTAGAGCVAGPNLGMVTHPLQHIA